MNEKKIESGLKAYEYLRRLTLEYPLPEQAVLSIGVLGGIVTELAKEKLKDLITESFPGPINRGDHGQDL